MTMTEISNKFIDKDRRISEMNQKIDKIKLEISKLDRQKELKVQYGESEQAIKLVRGQRDKEDELKILYQIRDNMKNTPAVTREEIIEMWNITSDKARVEFEEKVLPELKDAFERYSQAVEAVAILRQKTHEMASKLNQISKTDDLYVCFDNPFQGANLAKYYPNRVHLCKLNNLDGIFSQNITRPVSYGTLI